MAKRPAAPPRQADTEPLLPDFRRLFDASPRPLLLIAADPRYTMVAVNPAHAAAFGTTPEALCGWGVLEVFPPNADARTQAFAAAIRESLERVVATAQPDQMATRAYVLQSEDGASAERYWTAVNSPLLRADGSVSHILSACQDVTGEVREHRGEVARDLLMREVDHRARNALTVVQSFVRLTQATDLEEFRAILAGRVDALARAQTSLGLRRWEGAGLKEIVEAELGALSSQGRHVARGPAVTLAAAEVQAMSMAVHELATNAWKYGSLASTTGRLSVTWTHEDDGRLELVWRESGGPPVVPPAADGFGSRLIRQLARQLGGEVAFRWREDGLQATLTVRLGEPPLPVDRPAWRWPQPAGT